VIGPEQGFTLPGTTIVCGDSHTSTHGAFGALAHGIGTSESSNVLATQTLIQDKAKNMRITVDGVLGEGVGAKDIVLAIIGEIGTAGGTGHVIEYAGAAIRALSVEGRMTVCNMTIEAGARAGLIAPDAKTFAISKAGRRRQRARPGTPPCVIGELAFDEGAVFDKEVRLDASQLPPLVTWGTSPQMSPRSPAPCRPSKPVERDEKASIARALNYMGLKGGEKITDINSTGCSSAPAPMAGSRICAPPQDGRG